jgi:SAM-dependent methyltransferase
MLSGKGPLMAKTVVSRPRLAAPEAEQGYWEEYFAVARRLGHSWREEAKRLASSFARLRTHRVSLVLDLGCGAGDLSDALSRTPFQVIGLDLASSALRFARERYPRLKLVQADVSEGLPFRPGAFDAVVACLALHYFPWDGTAAICEEIHRVLREEGIFLFRVNSTADLAHGAGRGRQLEPRLFEHNGRIKRFFTEADCRSMVRCFDLHFLEHRLIQHLDCVDGCWAVRQKAVWDGLVQKGGSPLGKRAATV